MLSLAWNLSLPAFQGPDEDSHFAYIQQLAETGSLQTVNSGTASHSTEQQELLIVMNLNPLRGALFARPAWTTADLKLLHEVERSEPPGSRSNGTGPNPQAKNPPLYYAVMAVPYRLFLWLPLLKRLFILRLFSGLFFLATILCTWLIAAELFAATWKRMLAASCVALEPQLAFMSAILNADIALAAATTAVLLFSIRMISRGPTMKRVLLASGFTAAAVLTHGRGLVTLPVLAVAMLAAYVVHRPALRDSLRRAAAGGATVLGAFLAYFLFGRAGDSGSLYGGQVSALNTSTAFNVKQFISSIYQFYFPRLPSMQPRLGPEYGYRQVFINTFYGTFGWLEITFRQRIYDVLQILSAVGIVGLYTTLAVRWRRVWRGWALVAPMLALLLTNIAFLHYVSYQALRTDGATDPLIVGRYLLPMISLFGLAIAFTVGSLPRRAGQVIGALILAGGLLLSLAAIGITATRFYG